MFGSLDVQCESTTSNSITLEGLEPCTVYHINITSVSIHGESSQDSLIIETNTNDAGNFHSCLCHTSARHHHQGIRNTFHDLLSLLPQPRVHLRTCR